jgi:hypothetical protein
LRFHGQQYTRPAVGARTGAIVLRTEFHVRHFSKPHQMAFDAAPDHEVGEVLRRVEADLSAQRKFALRRLDAAGRQLHVLAS